MIYFDVSTLSPHKTTGVGVYMMELLKQFHHQGVEIQPVVKVSRLKNRQAIAQALPQKKCNLLFPYTFSGCDLYHGPDFKLSTRGNFPRVVTVHDMVVFAQKYNAPDFYRKGIADLTRVLNSDLAAVVVNSHFTKNEVVKYFPHLSEKIHVTYLGCERPAPRQPLENLDLPEKYILFLGTLEKRKNLRGVIEAFEHFKRQGFPHKLVLAGKEAFGFAEVQALLERSEFKNDVHRLYYVSDAQIHSLYSRAEAFLFPSFYEGFGIPVLEAMALGCPVVTSTGGALDEITGEAALKAEATDSLALGEHLVRLVREASLREEMRTRGRAQAALFSWEKCARETLAVYEQVLGSSADSIKTF